MTFFPPPQAPPCLGQPGPSAEAAGAARSLLVQQQVGIMSMIEPKRRLEDIHFQQGFLLHGVWQVSRPWGLDHPCRGQRSPVPGLCRPGSSCISSSRGARKHSTLAAVVLEWSRARKRYERQGLLVEAQALEQAEGECPADEEASLPERTRGIAAGGAGPPLCQGSIPTKKSSIWQANTVGGILARA